MKNLCAVISRLMLVICLTVYGPSTMAGTGSDGVSFMEICADGVLQTIAVDASGAPVEPSAYCQECLSCCEVAGVALDGAHGSVLVSVLHDMPLGDDTHLALHLRNPDLGPMPRGPPVGHLSQLTLPDPVLTIFAITGHCPHREGRPASKDVTA
ncbi:hypothetical protein [Marivita sp. S2033]|uniref:hypothetical protein n=1 Tax=Marivita sp. S2033 TaxID=3373187 RepID=UPI0039820895